MSIIELWPELQALQRGDKLRLMQLLVADLAAAEGNGASIESDSVHAVWTPHDAYDAADVLMKALASEPAAK